MHFTFIDGEEFYNIEKKHEIPVLFSKCSAGVFLSFELFNIVSHKKKILDFMYN